MPPDERGGIVVNGLDSRDLGCRRLFFLAEEEAGAQQEAARRQAVVLGIPHLALGHRRTLVVDVPAVQPDLDVLQAGAHAPGPREGVWGARRGSLVQGSTPP